MLLPTTPLTSEELSSAIVPDPLVVSPETTVMEAIVTMSRLRSQCEHPKSNTQLQQLHIENRSSCVIVMECGQIIGILTERDVVRLSSRQQDLGQVAVRQVMTQPVITLSKEHFTDIFAVIHDLQRQQIRHLPILDEHSQLIGLITHETLRYTTQLLSLLRLRQVEEVMNRAVICASPDHPLAYIVQQMVDHRISSVVIVEPLNLTAAIPIGIITERDLVQFQALGLSLATTSAQAVMSTSPFSVQPTDSLWSVQQLMAQHFIHRVVVTGKQGELLGIVTQSSLLKTLNPLEIFNLAAILEAKVQRLEAEKVKLLENRASKLEQLVEARTSELKRQMQREACITKISSQIRDSLKLQEILDICVSELRTFLDCDRTLIYQFRPDCSGLIVAESVGADWLTVMGNHIADSCFQPQTDSLYDSGMPLIVNNDVDTAGDSDCHRKLLAQYQVKANLVVPIHVAGQQWGLLSSHHCREHRDWQANEADFLREISVQLAIAINQVNIHQQLQAELQERSQIELGLRESEERYRSIYEQAAVGFANANLEGKFINVNPRFCEMLGYSRAELLTKTVTEITHPDDQLKHQDIVNPLFSGESPYFFQEKRYVRKDGSYFWSNTGVSLVRDAAGNPKHTLAVIRDITAQKQAAVRLRKSEQRYASLAAAAPVGIFRTDLAGNCTYVNHRWCEITGITAAAAAGNGWQMALHPDDREWLLTIWAQAVQAKQAVQAEYRFQWPDGTVTWVYGQAVAERNIDGTLVGYVGTVTDISERKWAEDALKASEQRFRNMAANMPGAIFQYVLHPDGTDNLVYMSDGCYELWEVTAEAAVNNVQVLWDMVHPDDVLAMHESVLASAQTLQPWFQQWRITTPSGQLKWLEAAGRPERQENGDVVWDSLIMDISDRQQIEQELQLSLKALDRHFDTSLLAIIEWEDRQIKRWSKEAEHIFGWSEAEIQAMDMATWQFVYEADCDWVAHQMQALRSGAVQSGRFENRNYRKDGQVITCEWHSSVIFDDAGNPQSILSFAQDITARKQAEAQLQNLIAGTAATTGKDFFPALVSHIGHALDVSYVLVTELIDTELNTLAYWANGELQPNFSFPIAGKPCEQVQQNGIFYCEHCLQAEFPAHLDLVQMEATSYFGIALSDVNGQAIGSLCILAKQPIQDIQRVEQILRVFAARAAAELARQQATTALEHLNQNLERTIIERTSALQEREIRYRSLMDGATDAILLADEHGYFIEANRSFEQMLGYGQTEIQGMHFSQLHTPEDLPRLATAFEQTLKTGAMHLLDVSYRHKDGHIVPVDISAALINLHGEIIIQGILRDISERKQTEQAMKQQMAAIEAAVDGIAILRNGIYLYVNQAHLNLFDYIDAKVMVGKSWHILYSPQEIERFEQEVLPQLNHNRAWQGEAIAQRQDGSTFIQGLSLTLTEDDLLICVCRDISERKQLELALQRSQNQLSEVLDKAISGIIRLRFYPDTSTQYDYISPHCETNFGYSVNELMTNPDLWRSCIDPHDWENVVVPMMQTILAQHHDASYVIEYRFRRKDGKLCWILSKGFVQWKAEAGYWYLTIVETDISDRKHAENQLQESEQRFRYLADYAPVLVWLSESDKSCNYFNTGWLKFTGSTLEETAGYGWVKHLHPDDQQPCLEHYITAFDARQPFEQEYRLRRFDGVYRWFFETGVPRHSTNGEFLGYIGSCVDISDRKLAEAQLQQTNQELLRATQLKDEFLANMSHELRTPLNAILGISEALQEGIYGEFNPQQLKATDIISKSGHHLLDLINDILDVAKIESGQVELHYAPVATNSLCQSSLVFVKQQAFQKNIQLQAKLPSDSPWLFVDERRIRQVLINLLTNAVKFTPKGGQVMLEVSQSTCQSFLQNSNVPPPQSLRISIQDTGIGIAPEYLHKLFQPFVQIDSALNRQYTGTGLGLALVKCIVELHGGTVAVTSELGKGSCFTIELPYITDASAALSQENHSLEQLELTPVPNNPNSPVILLAEDNEANIMTFSSYLRSKGYRLVVANNGQAAIDLIPLEHPDLILMDIQMPGMDGIEAIQRIRNDPHSTDIPIIALTALAMEGDRERCLKVGANDYLTKPVRLQQLAVTIQRLLEGTSAGY